MSGSEILMVGRSTFDRAVDPRYEELPGVLKHLYSPEEFAWLNDMRKRELQRIETEPEWTEP